MKVRSCRNSVLSKRNYGIRPKFLNKPVFIVLIAVLAMSVANAQVEFRDSNSFQFFNDISVEEGEIKMNQNRIVGLPEAESSGEPVTQADIGDNVVDRGGDSMEGNLEMQGNIINMGGGNIEDISQLEAADIAGLNYIEPDERLQITEEVDIESNLDVDGVIEGEGNRVVGEAITGYSHGDDPHYILLAENGAESVKLGGRFHGYRHESSSYSTFMMTDVVLSTNDEGEDIAGSISYVSATKSGELEPDFVTLDYNGDSWYALELDFNQVWASPRFYVFTGQTVNTEFNQVDNEDVENVEQLDLDYEGDSGFSRLDELNVGGSLNVEGETEFENTVELTGGSTNSNDYSGTLRARNFGYLPGSGASHYLLGQSGDRWLRWRDGWGATYGQFSVGSADARDYDEMFSVDGDSIFEGNVDLDGNEIENVNELSAEDEESVTIDGDLDVDGRVDEGLYDEPDCLDHEYAEGDGSESNPYIVRNPHDLQCIHQDMDAYYEQGQNIDASPTRYWNDGTGFDITGSDFNGVFDGNFHEIRGLYFNDEEETSSGVFGEIYGEVKNLVMKDAYVSGGHTVSIISYRVNGGTVSRVGIENSRVEAEYYVGTISGHRNYGTIEESYVRDTTVAIVPTPPRSGDTRNNGCVAGGNYDVIRDTYVVNCEIQHIADDSRRSGAIDGRSRSDDAEYINVYVGGDLKVDGSGSDTNVDVGTTSGATFEDSYTDASGSDSDTTRFTELDREYMTDLDAEVEMEGFDFEETWRTELNDYPRLTWEHRAHVGDEIFN